MTDDILSYLLSDPTGQEQSAAQAAALRRQRDIGTLGMLTGDRVLSGLGKNLFSDASSRESQISSPPSAAKLRLALEAQKMANVDPELQQQQLEADINLKNARAGFLSRPKGAAQMDPERQRYMELRNQKLQRDLEGTGQADPKFAMALRKEFSGLPEVKSYKDVQVSFDKISRAAQNPSPAGDLSLVFSYMKMLDPGSTVREGEFANAQNATGVPGQIANQYNRLVTGERLSEGQRKDFSNQAKSLFESHLSQYGSAASKYRGLAKKSGIAPEDIADEPSSGGSKKPAGLAPDKKARLEELRKKKAAGLLK